MSVLIFILFRKLNRKNYKKGTKMEAKGYQNEGKMAPGTPTWAHGATEVIIWGPLGVIWVPLGAIWAPIGSTWAPFGSPWAPFGGPWASFGILG